MRVCVSSGMKGGRGVIGVRAEALQQPSSGRQGSI